MTDQEFSWIECEKHFKYLEKISDSSFVTTLTFIKKAMQTDILNSLFAAVSLMSISISTKQRYDAKVKSMSVFSEGECLFFDVFSPTGKKVLTRKFGPDIDPAIEFLKSEYSIA